MKNTFAKAALALLVLAAPVAANGQTVRYRVVPLPEIGTTTNCVPTAINENGDVVGYCEAGQVASFGVLWRAGVAKNLGLWQGSVGTQAWAINSLGQIAGQGDDGDGKEIQALFYNGTAWVEVDGSGGSDQRALGITDAGVILGNFTSTGNPGFADWDPVMWIFDADHNRFDRVDLPKPPGTLTGAFINAASKSGWAAGQVTSEAGNSAGLWKNDAAHTLVVLVHPLTLGSTAVAFGVSDAGHAVGAAISGIFPPVERALLWQNDADHTAVEVGLLSGHVRSQALAVNDAGLVVGVSYGATGAGRGFVFQNGSLTELSTVLDAGSSGWIINEPAGINNAGQIIASATLNGARQPVILEPVETTPEPIGSVALTADHTAPQQPGTTITFTATATGGVSPHQFKWLVSDGTTTAIAQDWSTTASFAWTPATSNSNYKVIVRARSDGNSADAGEQTAEMAFPIVAVASGVTLVANPAAPQVAGTAITFTATAAGGTEPYQFKWLLWDGATETVAQDWSSAATFAWTPTIANDHYRITVWVRSAGNGADVAEQAASQTYQITRKLITRLTVTADKTAPQVVGSTITFTASAEGGTAPYQFKWAVSDGITSATAKDWSTDTTFAWTPTAANDEYVITVLARSADAPTDAAEITETIVFPIKRPVISDVTVAADKDTPQPVGTTITFTATATGGTAPHEFKWLVSDGSAAPAVAQDWGASATFAWTPQAAKTYTVTVWARSAGNTEDAFEAAREVTFAITDVVEPPPPTAPHDNRDGLKLLPGKRLGKGAPDFAPRGSRGAQKD